MERFDVLTSHQWVGSGEKSWYFVTSVRASSESVARAVARRRMASFFQKNGRALTGTSVHGVGPMGCYDGFVGKYVGQFIAEAL